MTAMIRHYYAKGNTARGLYSLYDSVLEGLDRVYILIGGTGVVTSSLLKTIGEVMEAKALDVDYIQCASDNNSIDGVILPTLKVGIVDGTAPTMIEAKAPGIIEKYVNLGIALDTERLATNKEVILKLNEAIAIKFKSAYDTFAAALRAHDEIEDIYISNMDFSEANKLTTELIAQFFDEEILDKKSTIKHRFLGAATPNGAVDYIQNLTEDIEKRYFVKGRAGSGKSTMLKKLVAAGEEKGFDLEVYHCGFDPNSLDMVIFREKGIAIFDSTAPHEYFPDRDSDEIIDMYERCITVGTDEKYATEIARTTKAYKDKMKEAISYLAEAKELRDKQEPYYLEAMDFTKIEEIQQSLLDEIEKFINK